VLTPQVSVLLTSWNTREEIRRCLDSLGAAASDALRYEVIAVDNASVDGSAELLAADPRVRLIRNRRNVGFAAAVNQAYRVATGELILLLNSDVSFHPGALDTMAGFLRERPDAAGVSPLCLNPDGSFQQHYVQLPSFAASLALFTMLRRAPGFRGALHRFELRGQDFSAPRPLASGSCLLLRAAVVGPNLIFDESFPIYWNDAVFVRQLEAAGHRLWMIPNAVVTHTRGASCRRLGPAMRCRHLLGGLVGYLRLTQPGYRLAIFRAVLLANYLVKTVAGRPTALGPGDLLAALRGDVGPLPTGDARDWAVVVGPERWLDHQQRSLHEEEAGDVAGRAIAQSGGSLRLLLVEPPGPSPRWRLETGQAGPSVWRLRLPTVLPFGHRLTGVNWVNGRIGAAVLRRWLDRHAGARTLHVDRGNAHLVGWLGEDVAARIEPAPRTPEFSRG
jgi:GT2 family glycosyltransferase